LRGKGTGDVRFPCGVRRPLQRVGRFVKGGGLCWVGDGDAGMKFSQEKSYIAK